LRRRLALAPLALLTLAAAVFVLPVPRQQRMPSGIQTEAACAAAGGQWNYFHLSRPGEPKNCLLAATDGGQRCLSTWHCAGSVCRPNPAASETDGFQVGRCDGTSWRGDCGEIVRNGFRRNVDCPLE